MRLGILAAGTFPIASLAALLLHHFSPSWPSQGLWTLVITVTLLGGVSGIFLGLVDDIRTTKRLYEIRQTAKEFLGDERIDTASNIESSVDNSRQIRFTQGDAPRFEHYHLEMRGEKGKFIVENYVCGSEDVLAEIVQYAGWVNKRSFFTFVHQPVGKIKSMFCLAGISPELAVRKNHLFELPAPNFLLIEKWQNGFYLFRITKNLEYAGDTWHESLQEAKHQAEYEYNVLDTDWKTIPSKVKDGISYILEQDSR